VTYESEVEFSKCDPEHMQMACDVWVAEGESPETDGKFQGTYDCLSKLWIV
jgi:hypothetical protein